MGDIRGFLKVQRKTAGYRPVCERIRDYREVMLPSDTAHAGMQASRCMDCGTPFCHWACPIGNYIPEWNDALFRGQMAKASALLNASNNLAEITGRICPALCEYSCVLGLNDDAVTIRENELAIIEHAFAGGLIKPVVPARRTGKSVAVIGSGPAGLACAMQLNRAGHRVVVFEKDDKPGGLLRYGIPDFKLDKSVVDRRIDLMRNEGIEFCVNTDVGSSYPASALKDDFDAVCLCGGSRVPRDLAIEGRALSGIHFAMDYLTSANKAVAQGIQGGRRLPAINARGKKVVVIGGGDTGADCVGVAHRQQAACVVQIELMPQPPGCRTETMPWPKYPLLLKVSSSHQEGGERKWAVLTKKFLGRQGAVCGLACVNVEFSSGSSNSCPGMKEIPGSAFEIEADLVILALGFLHPQKHGLLEQLGVALDARTVVATDTAMMTSVKGVFAAGDMRRGQSLVVWAVNEGRRAAYSIDSFLVGRSYLPAL